MAPTEQLFLDATAERRLQYNLLLKRLKVKADYEDYIDVINKQEQSEAERLRVTRRLNDFLDELDAFIKHLEDSKIFSRKLMIDWYKITTKPSCVDKILVQALKKSQHCFSCYQAYLILAINLIGLILNFSTKQYYREATSSDPGLSTHQDIGTITGQVDSAINIMTSVIDGANLIEDGEVTLGTLNIFNGIKDLAHYTIKLVGVALPNSSFAASVPFVGVAATTVGIAIGMVIECMQIRKAKNQIKKTQELLENCTSASGRENLNQLLLVEYDNLATHKKQLHRLTITSAIIITFTVLSFTALSSFTFGALPLSGLILASVLIAFRLYKIADDKVNKPDKRLDMAKENYIHITKANAPGRLLQDSNVINAWNHILNEAIDNQGFITLKTADNQLMQLNILNKRHLTSSFFKSEPINFKTYVDKLFIKHPEKTQKVVQALFDKDYQKLEEALAIRQHSKLDYGLSRPTFGQRLLSELTQESPLQPALTETQ